MIRGGYKCSIQESFKEYSLCYNNYLIENWGKSLSLWDQTGP